MISIVCPNPTFVDWSSGVIQGDGIEESVTTIGHLSGLFLDEAARQTMDPDTEVYRVRYWRPVAEGTTGGLFWGATILMPGRVGAEYFMTKGHFHAIRDRAEFYATVKGDGVLMLMSEDGEVVTQKMNPGSVHYIPGTIAHRTINTGEEPLVFVASWHSDAGHDYDRIRKSGFSKRVLCRDGSPCIL
jgi:glucose-6-phosphate isomerase